jgi:serine/threonine protein kinase
MPCRVPPDRSASIETNTFGPYRLDQMLGRGGMGEVYRAFDTDHERTVAVKRLAPHLADDPEFQVRFRREARVAARLRSPHVIPIHRYGEIDGQLYIDMRFVDGGDLHDLVQTTGGLALDRAVHILEQVAHAVDDAHANGLVHRDVKPSNILLDRGVRDFCYLSDFGITRAAAASTTSHSLTRTGALLGSLAYMAPEQFDGALTKRSDVYSLTCVFFEMITGVRPYAGEGLPALMHQHLKIPPPRPSERNPGTVIFDELVATGMAKDAGARFDSAGALARAARSALDTHRATSTVAPAGAPPPPLDEEPEREPERALGAHRIDEDHADPATSSSREAGPPIPAAGADVTSPVPPLGADEPTQDLGLRVGTPPPHTNGTVPRRLLPLGAVLAVLALIATTWAVAGRGGTDQDRAVPAAADPTPAATAPAAPPSAAAASVRPGPTLTEAVFTGRSSGNELTVAVGVKDGRAAGYLCDGKAAEAWLEGELVGDQLTLHGRDANTQVTATVDQRSLLGNLVVGGTVRPFSAQIATGPAGLFQSRRTVEGITTRIGWIVLPDGTQVGVRNQDAQRSPAPPFDPVTLFATEDGRPIPVERLSGASVVLGG